MHLQTASLYGNATDMQYFFVDIFVGSDREKQSLIVDTGSGIAAMPCKNYCNACGTNHLNPFYDFDGSRSKYLYNCKSDRGCTCME